MYLQLYPWLTSLGLSLCFGTIMAKMVRVFYIFNNPSMRKKHVCAYEVLSKFCSQLLLLPWVKFLVTSVCFFFMLKAY